MSYQACIPTKSDTGSYWTTIASGSTENRCIANLESFLETQPLHHWGINDETVIRLYSVADATFIRNL